MTKNPSEPSRITSAISCMARGPTSLVRMSHNIHNETKIKQIEIINAEKQIKLDVEFEMQM